MPDVKTLQKIFRKTFAEMSATLLIGALLLTMTGCAKKEEEKENKITELTYYRLFDGEDVFKPLIETYESEHPDIRIIYKKFTDSKEYMDLIINELAEGEGPDLFSLNSADFFQHRRKLVPAPVKMISPDEFKKIFVPVASKDLLLPDESGKDFVYGLPLYVDTLALYYNADQIKEALTDREKPAKTWGELQEDVKKLTIPDLSFERFERAGIAMGRADNVLRATDILYALFLQFGVKFYNEIFNETTFAEGVKPPSVEVFNLFLSFGLPDSPYFSWNNYIASPESAEKEIIPFARGKVSMIFGYSYLYDQILDTRKELDRKGSPVIKESAIQVAPLPQLEGPDANPEARRTYANYFAETVSRTSQHPEEAWEFLNFLVSKENLRHYHEKTHRPTSRLDLLDEQRNEPIYGVFADQLDYAESLLIPDSEKVDAILRSAIQEALTTKTPEEALQNAQIQINENI